MYLFDSLIYRKYIYWYTDKLIVEIFYTNVYYKECKLLAYNNEQMHEFDGTSENSKSKKPLKSMCLHNR